MLSQSRVVESVASTLIRSSAPIPVFHGSPANGMPIHCDLSVLTMRGRILLVEIEGSLSEPDLEPTYSILASLKTLGRR